MKTVKFLIVMLALLLTCSVAQAQTTPEAIIGQTPDLPSAATLAAAANSSSDESAAEKAVKTFHAKIEALHKKNAPEAISDAEIAQAQTQARADAEKQAKALTGKSVAELQNMSEAEAQSIADKAVQQRMAAAGLENMNLAELQNMNEDDLMAKMAGNMGLTAAEMKAMEGMSDKEIEAYMKQGDRMQRMQNSSMSKAAAKNQSTQPQLNEAEMYALQNAVEERRKYMERIDAMSKLHERERTELAAQIRNICNRHYSAPAYLKAQKIWGDCSGKTAYTNAQCEAAAAQVRAAHTACDTECFDLWRNQIAKEQGRIKTLLPDAGRMDDLQAQAAKAQAKLQKNASAFAGITQKVSDGLLQRQVVTIYLDTTESVVNFPYNDNE
jgi:hypothetical protein